MQCPLCGTENNRLAIRCVKCHSYLQSRIPNIDLFPILWKLLEKPRTAFKEIALAEHKNYSFLLFCIVGMYITSIVFSLIKVGEYYENLLEILTWILVVGSLSGISLSILLPLHHMLFGKLFGFKVSFRNALGLLAYALTPFVYAFLFLFPIKLLAFGLYCFTSNPHPAILNSTLYYALLILELLTNIWVLVLVLLGTSVTYQVSLIRSIFVNFLTFILGFGIVYYCVKEFVMKLTITIF